MEFKHIYRDVQFSFIDLKLILHWIFTRERVYHVKLFQTQIGDKINELHSALKHIDLGYCFFQRKICGQLFNIG